MKANDLRAMAPPAAKANFGFGWIAVQGAVCAVIAFGAYYAFSTPNLMPGSGPKTSLADQTLSAVARVTSEAPRPVEAPTPPPPPTPAQEAASRVMAFLSRVAPTDPTFAACAKAQKSDPNRLTQQFIHGEHEPIARAADCYLSSNPARLCHTDQRQAALDVLGVYFVTKRAQIAAERDQPNQPVVAAGRWESPIDKSVRARFRNAVTNGFLAQDAIAQHTREAEMLALVADLKPQRRPCAAAEAVPDAEPAAARKKRG
jgi:hypothetical protein